MGLSRSDITIIAKTNRQTPSLLYSAAGDSKSSRSGWYAQFRSRSAAHFADSIFYNIHPKNSESELTLNYQTFPYLGNNNLSNEKVKAQKRAVRVLHNNIY